MGLFDRLKGKENIPFASDVISAAVKGNIVTMDKIPDDVFSSGMLGICCGIDPTEGNVYAPMDGIILNIADTLHAIGIEGNGVELILHIGIDTVRMKGEGFSSKVKVGKKVKRGDLLMTMDLEKIISLGYPAVVITIVTNSDNFETVALTASGAIEVGDELMKVKRK